MATGSNQRNGGAQSAHSERNTHGSRRGAQKKGGKAIVFIVELVVIALLIGVLVVTVKAFGGNGDGQEEGNFVSKLFSNIGDAFGGNEGKDAKGISFVKLEEEQLKIAEEVKQNEVMKGYMNVALFGVCFSPVEVPPNFPFANPCAAFRTAVPDVFRGTFVHPARYYIVSAVPRSPRL